MLASLSESLIRAGWSDGLVAVRFCIFTGGVLGTLLALTEWDGFFPTFYAFVAGVAATLASISNLVLASIAMEAGVREMVIRNGAWVAALVQGSASADNLVFISQLAFLGWWLGFLAAWGVVRHHHVLIAAIPVGAALLLNTYLSPLDLSGFVALFLATTLLLAVRLELAQNETRWQVSQVRYAPDIARGFLRAGLLFAGLVLAISWAVPDVANAVATERLLRPLEAPWQRVKDTWQRMYQDLNYGSVASQSSAFGDSVSFGGPVTLTDRRIFTAESSRRLYWRAALYDTYTGSGWENTDRDVVIVERDTDLAEPPIVGSFPVTVTVMPAAPQQAVIAPPGVLRVSVPTNAHAEWLSESPEAYTVSMLRSRLPLGPDRGYSAVSQVPSVAWDQLRGAGDVYPQYILERYLQLPGTLPDRVVQLAQQLTGGLTTPLDKTRAIEAALRQYTYDQDIAAPPPGTDGVDYFLFEIARGYCDYYASAMVVMLRAVGVPARYAAGYTPGEVIPQPDGSSGAGATWEVQERNGHAWPEVYFPAFGWIPFEPTASEPALARPDTFEDEDLDSGLMSNDAPPQPLDQGFDTPAAPPELPPAPESSATDRFLQILPYLALAGLAALAGYVALRLATTRRAAYFSGNGAAERMFWLLGIWAARLRIPWRSSATPRERAAELGAKVPEASPAAGAIAEAFVAERYGRSMPGEDSVQEMAQQWRRLEPTLWRKWLAAALGPGGQRPRESNRREGP
jgi:transglutaminase-like putative cysteine protease